jgi:hypothetical protein
MESMIGMENLPDEIVLKILGYLGLGQLIQCARVSKSLNNICKDRSLSYRSSMLVMKNLTVKVRKSIVDILIARPQVKKVKMRMSTFVKAYKCAVHVRTQEYRKHGKKAQHLMILKNKLYLQAGMPTLTSLIKG